METLPAFEPKKEKPPIDDMGDFSELCECIKEKGLTNDNDAFYAESQLIHIKALQSEIEEHHAESIDNAHQTHKSMIKARDKFMTPLKEAEKVIKKAVGSYCLEDHAKGVSVSKKFKAEIIDLDSIPDNLVEPKANIKAIEAILNAGGTVDGVKAIECNTVRVKA
jgi:hypothetical protein